MQINDTIGDTYYQKNQTLGTVDCYVLHHWVKIELVIDMLHGQWHTLLYKSMQARLLSNSWLNFVLLLSIHGLRESTKPVYICARDARIVYSSRD